MPAFSQLKAIATERITIDNTAGGVRLTFSNFLSPPLAKTAMLLLETAAVRWLANGTEPTSTTGNIAYPGDKIILENPSELWEFRGIRTGATSGAAQVTYYGD